MQTIATLVLSAAAFLNQMTQAHNAEAYHEQQAVSAELVVEFPGAFKMEGTMLFDTALGKSRLNLKDGTSVVFDGEKAWVTPAEKASPMMRFHVLTWPYFLAAPFKMNDPGVNVADPAPVALDDADDLQPAAKVTFDAGTGDAPDDWYCLFLDGKKRLKAMGYIVTYTKSQEEAEAKPSIILYDGFETVGDVTFSTKWTFHYWSPKTGIAEGDPKGSATVSNLKFVEFDAGMFEKPDGSAEATLPE